MIPSKFQGHAVRIAKVVDTHPKGNCVDLVALDNLARMEKVQVMSPSAWTDGGLVNLPQVSVREGEEKWSIAPTGERDMYAMVMMTDVFPVVIGFLPAQVNQLAFDKAAHPDLFVERHASDLYRCITADGSMTLRHPGGTEITIGAVPDLSGQDYDRKFEIKHNTGVHPSVTLRAGTSVITVQHNGDILIQAEGSVHVTGTTITLN